MSSSRTAKVLVVEDEQDIAGLIKHALERSGEMQAAIVTTGDAALHAVAEQPPDVMILDLNLPVLSGTEVRMGVRTPHRNAVRRRACRPPAIQAGRRRFAD